MADLKVLMKFIMTTTPAGTTLSTHPYPLDTTEDESTGDDYVCPCSLIPRCTGEQLRLWWFMEYYDS